jgi:hypothetical protein
LDHPLIGMVGLRPDVGMVGLRPLGGMVGRRSVSVTVSVILMGTC